MWGRCGADVAADVGAGDSPALPIHHKAGVHSTPTASSRSHYPAPMLRNYFYRRTLPHYQGNQQAIFATFASYHRWHLPESARDLVAHACLHLDGTKCSLHGFVVMPDHVHLVFTPLMRDDEPIALPEVLQKVKSESAHLVNKSLGRTGRVWQDESFDHVLRRSEGIAEKLDYVRMNPVRAGLATDPSQYRWMWFKGEGASDEGAADVGAADVGSGDSPDPKA